MRYFSYNEPIWSDDRDEHDQMQILGNQVITKSEDEIRAEYFPYWESRMIEKYGADTYARTYGFEDCLEDWVIVNFAWEVTD